jgi:SP family facilitated glucose transporter-like MFS transporter 8
VGVLGNLVTPPLLATLGPRRSLLLVCLPLFTLAWLGLVLARLLPSLGLVLASRALCGVPIGMSISIAPGFIIDIASQERQGLLGLLPQLMVSLGLLFSYVVGALVDWWWLSLVNLLLQVIEGPC